MLATQEPHHTKHPFAPLRRWRTEDAACPGIGAYTSATGSVENDNLCSRQLIVGHHCNRTLNTNPWTLLIFRMMLDTIPLASIRMVEFMVARNFGRLFSRSSDSEDFENKRPKIVQNTKKQRRKRKTTVRS